MTNIIMPTHPWITHIEGTLYKQTFPSDCSTEDLAAYLQAIEQLVFQINEPYAFVIDLGGIISTSSEQRRLTAESDKRQRDHDKEFCAGVAYYAKAAWTRGLVTAVYWLQPPVYPYEMFSDQREAENWARQRLRDRGAVIGGEVTSEKASH